MRDNRVIAIAGPQGAGKDTILYRLVDMIPGLVRGVSCTTRSPRPGEVAGRDYQYISEAEFEASIAQKRFIDWMPVRHYRSGLPKSELERSPKVVVNVGVSIARAIQQYAVTQGGKVFSLFVTASERERRRRIMARQPGLAADELERMITDDPSPGNVRLSPDFVVVKNPDGMLDITVAAIADEVRQFLNTR